MTTILAISGSLRSRSSNTELLRAAALLAPDGVTISVSNAIAGLPHFNPDLDEEGATLPAPVSAFRAQVAAADALLVSSPEYAHGVPGVLKNALDWLVSGPEIPYKPTGLLNASARSTHAHAALVETLRTMSAHVVEGASTTVALDGLRLSADAIAASPELAGTIRAAVQSLVNTVGDKRQRL